jgi:hypothetical protein
LPDSICPELARLSGASIDAGREIIRLVEQLELRARMGHTARAIAEKRGRDAVNAQIAPIMAEAL